MNFLLNFFCSERKRQREREENWKILQRKVSGTSSITITETVDYEQQEEYSFPPKSKFEMDELKEDEQDFYIMTDEETDAETHHEEHHDVIHPQMQQFDPNPQQFQQFRRKSIIPVDETVCIL